MSPNRAVAFALALVLAGLVMGLTGQAARAQGSIRYAKPSATGSGDCSSWVDACRLQTALTGASSGEIWVMQGTHKPTDGTDRSATFQLKSGVAVYGGFPSTGNPGFADRSSGTYVTLLSGDLNGDDVGFSNNGENSYHVVTGATGATLDGVTISGGNANGGTSCPGAACGGGMANTSSSPTLANITFNSNSAGAGGGMYNDQSSPTLTNVTFSGNAASGSGGGMANVSSSPTLTNVTFNSNAAGGYGGGMDNYSSNPNLTNVTFSLNRSDASGGGMDNCYSNPTLLDVVFSSNSAAWEGGAMSNGNSSPTLTNVTISYNSADGFGGGIYNENSSPSLSNVVIIGNSSAGLGGGGIADGVGSNPTLINVTLFGNSAEYGGGMFNYASSPIVHNSIIWDNAAPADPEIRNHGARPTFSDSVIQGGCPADSACSNIVATDPLLGTLGNYTCPGGQCQGGGSTQTIPLLPGSSAIDAGNDATCVSTDQRGVARPQGANCDIGAFESRGFSLAKTAGDHQSAEITTLFAMPLTVNATSAYGEPVNGGVLTFRGPASGASTNPLAATATIESGAASKSLAANSTVGSYAVTVSGSGVGSPVSFELSNLKASTVTVVTGHSPHPSKAEEAVTVSYSVTVNAPGSGTPTGNVTVSDGVDACTGIVAAGKCVMTLKTVGTRTLSATYAGNGNFNGSLSVGVAHTVNPQAMPTPPRFSLNLPLVVR